MEQQHEDAVDAQHTGCHGQPETGYEVVHVLCVARVAQGDIGRQLHGRRQGSGGLNCSAQRCASEGGGDCDVTAAVEPSDLVRAAFECEAGDAAQGNCAASRRDREIAQRLHVRTESGGHLHRDRNLSAIEIELGQARVEVGACRDTNRTADRFRSDPQIRSTCGVRTNDDLGPFEVRTCHDVRQPGQFTDIPLERLGTLGQRDVVVARENQFEPLVVVARREREACAGDLQEGISKRRLDVLLGLAQRSLVEHRRHGRMTQIRTRILAALASDRHHVRNAAHSAERGAGRFRRGQRVLQ